MQHFVKDKWRTIHYAEPWFFFSFPFSSAVGSVVKKEEERKRNRSAWWPFAGHSILLVSCAGCTAAKKKGWLSETGAMLVSCHSLVGRATTWHEILISSFFFFSVSLWCEMPHSSLFFFFFFCFHPTSYYLLGSYTVHTAHSLKIGTHLKGEEAQMAGRVAFFPIQIYLFRSFCPL